VKKSRRKAAAGFLSLFVAFIMCASSGCSFFHVQPDPVPTMGMEQVEELILAHLHEKYGEDFVLTKIRKEDSAWIMEAHRVGDPEDVSSFRVAWTKPESGSSIYDEYLLVKMRPLFLDAIEDGLGSVLSEFVAQFNLTLIQSADFSSLPGGISEEDFRIWAARNVNIFVYTVIPSEAGITRDELTAQLAPLTESGNKFGVAQVSLEVYAYFPDAFPPNELPPGCFGPKSDGQRVFPGGFCDFWRPHFSTGFRW